MDEQPGTITGSVLADTDNDNVGESTSPIASVILTLKDSSGNDVDSDPNTTGVQPTTTTTQADGGYSFTNVPPGSYQIVQTQPSGYLSVSDVDGSNLNTIGDVTLVTVSAGTTTSNQNFVEEQPATISGFVLKDTDNDNAGDSGLGGVTVTLYTDPNGDGNPADGAPYGASVTTDSNGAYSFSNLAAGAYVIVETQPAGYLNVTDEDTSTDTTGSPADAANSSTTDNRIPVNVGAGETDTANTFVEEQPGTISGFVKADTDNDNVGDVGIPNVTLTLKDSSGNDVDSDPNATGVQPTTTTTDSNGAYNFTNVPPGSYQVVQTQPSGYLSVSDVDGGNLNTIGDVTLISVTTGGSVASQNFVEEQPGSISGTVLADTDGDNIGDVGIPNVSLTLYTDPNGDGDSSDGVAMGIPVITLADGSYTFNNLAPGNYVVVQTQPAGYLTVTDTDSTTDASGSPADAANSSTTDNRIPVNIAVGETDNGNNFIEEQPASIGNLVWNDSNGNGLKDATELGIDGVVIELLDASGASIDSDPNASGVQPTTTTTAGGGLYSFANLAPGSYQLRIATPPSATLLSLVVTAGIDNGIDNDDNGIQATMGGAVTSPVIALSAGETETTVDFGFTALTGSYTISGQVRDDYDLDGNFSDNDQPFASVTVKLYLDSNGNGVFDLGIDTLVETQTTDTFGNYQFTGLPDGNYFVQEVDPVGATSTADAQGNNDNLVPVVIAGANSTGNDFLDAIDPAGYAYSPVTGQIIAGGSISVSGPGTFTILLDGSTGQYSFITDGTPGTYTLTYFPPLGYIIDPTRPVAGTNFDPTGGPNPTIVGSGESTTSPGYLADFTSGGNPYYLTFDLTAGDPLVINNNIPLVEIKPSTFAAWQFANPLGGQNGPTQDPDGDGLTNFEEFAFYYNPSSGVASGCPLQIMRNPDGTIDVKVRRLTVASGMTYTLEYIADLASSTANGGGWTPLTTTIPSVITNPEGTEVALYHDLAQIPSLASGKGYVRVKVSDGTNTARTYAVGWGTQTLAIGCQTSSQPYLKCAIFNGSVDNLAGNVLTVATSVGSGSLNTQFVTGTQYYLEVTSGDNVGHRWDINEAASTATTIAIDTSSPSNTQASVPANLASDSIVVRQHLTFAEAYPPANFTGTNNPATADRLLFFDRSTGAFKVYWLYNGTPKRWVLSTDSGLSSQNNTVLDPCAGHFIHPKTVAVTQVYTGEIRENAFVCPLLVGNNLIAGGWPMDQSPNSRAMTAANGFIGTRDPATSDRIRLWVGDTFLGTESYDSHFYLIGGARQQWTPQSNANLLNENNVNLFKAHRSASLQVLTPINWSMPMPWIP